MTFSINDAIDVFYFKILLQKFCQKIEKKIYWKLWNLMEMLNFLLKNKDFNIPLIGWMISVGSPLFWDFKPIAECWAKYSGWKIYINKSRSTFEVFFLPFAWLQPVSSNLCKDYAIQQFSPENKIIFIVFFFVTFKMYLFLINSFNIIKYSYTIIGHTMHTNSWYCNF